MARPKANHLHSTVTDGSTKLSCEREGWDKGDHILVLLPYKFNVQFARGDTAPPVTQYNQFIMI